MSEEQENRWRINREVSLGDILAIVIAVGSVITAYMSLSARVTVVEVMAAQTANSLNGTVSEIKTELRRLNDRLERMVDQMLSDNKR